MKKHCFAVFIAAALFSATLPQDAFARNAELMAPNNASGWVSQTGTASYYGPTYNGHRSADGARFDQTALTAAHPWLPFGTKVRVTLANSSRSVIVTITDRVRPGSRIVDLSMAAARELGIIRRGVAKVTLVPA